MSTLGSLLTAGPDLELTVAWPRHSITYRNAEIAGLAVLSSTELLKAGSTRTLPAGSLVLVIGEMPFRVRGSIAAALEALLQQMALDQCVGLVVSTAPGQPGHQPFPQSIRDLSDDLGIPLLVTTARSDRWAHVDAEIQHDRLTAAEQRAEQLNALVQQLPSQLADPKAMQRIADWLARALSVQVLVSETERVLAASPDTAAEHLAHAIIRQSVDCSTPDFDNGPHTQLIPLAPANGAQAVLAVARKSPFDNGELRLLHHAAKLLGLIEQACREYRAVATASHATRLAAVELLLEGEVSKARRIMQNLQPGMLDTEMARVFVVETSATRRDATLRRCETVAASRALVVADPQRRDRVLIIHPVWLDEPANSVVGELTRLVCALRPGASLGGSGTYSLSLLTDALNEATIAARFAVHDPGSVALSVQETDLITLLPPHASQRWAREILKPLTQTDTWDLLRDTLPTALAYPYTVAARRLELHRNTVMRRMTRAAELMGRDFTALTDRITVALALEVVTHREPSDPPAEARDNETPTLHTLLDTPQIHAWADSLLSTARTDRRDLLATASAWLTADAHLEPTARELGLSDVTVRSHLRALEAHLGRDLSSLDGMRDLYVALNHTTGKLSTAGASQVLNAVA
ncbi:helix-turn-helix domain-containing protein [Streptomyces sp. NPDC005732]|uniref:helix-turn-helix domain-containing protein n=1 Tax=Streptomyces sp. NPDC005732 TaxID=3157057 RepID=UPI0033F0BEC0